MGRGDTGPGLTAHRVAPVGLARREHDE